eukprot:IDg3063t1
MQSHFGSTSNSGASGIGKQGNKKKKTDASKRRRNKLKDLEIELANMRSTTAGQASRNTDLKAQNEKLKALLKNAAGASSSKGKHQK